MVFLEEDPFRHLKERYPCREAQILQLSQLLSPLIPSPPALVVHGLEATCKSTIVRNILTLNETPYVIIQSQECITGRHLLEQTLAACLHVVETTSDTPLERSRYARCENLAALSACLHQLLEGCQKMVIVFDGIDHQREAPPTMYSALARLGEMITNLTVVFIVSFPKQRFLHTSGTPHIHFASYSREESIQIVSNDPPSIFTEPLSTSDTYSEQAHREDKEWLWPRFCAAVWDSLAKNMSRDVISFRALAEKLWRPFVASIVDGTYGTRDFSKLMVAKRALFQNEEMLVERTTVKPLANASASPAKAQNELHYVSKYLLCAAYLASYNPTRTDATFFMRSNDKKRRKKGGGGARHGRPSQNRKISRLHLPPTPFPLDRLLSIFHAILPHSIPQNSDVLTSISSLTSLRLLTRSSTAGDVLDPTTARWKVNVGWEYVVAAGRGVGLEVEEFVVG